MRGMNDESSAPLIDEEAFLQGINFNVKMIGSLDIPRPLTRVEIVAAMRRVRAEFKSKGVKKKEVILSISLEGVKTCVRRRKNKKAQNNHSGLDEDDLVLKIHPIYRIFYVSHDSQDVKIFSYISREIPSNKFQCCVFKANNKKQALRIVRTVGQAFEVCQKLSGNPQGETDEIQSTNQELPRDTFPKINQVNLSPTRKTPPSSLHSQVVAGDKGEESKINSMRSPQQRPRPPPLVDTWREPISAQHETQLLKEKLEQQSMQTQAAVAQINLLRDQLAAESSARVEAQNRTQQLLLHNKELLDHLQTLVRHIQQLEGIGSPNLPQVPPATPPSPSHYTTSSSFQEIEALRRQNAALLETILYENNRLFYHHQQTSPSPIRVTISPALPPAYIYPYQGLVVGNSPLPTPQSSPRSQDSGSGSYRVQSGSESFTLPNLEEIQHQQQQQRYQFEASTNSARLQPPKLSMIGKQASNDEYGAGAAGSGQRSFLARSVSEKVGHKSESLMSQVQRSAWARHTTK